MQDQEAPMGYLTLKFEYNKRGYFIGEELYHMCNINNIYLRHIHADMTIKHL